MDDKIKILLDSQLVATTLTKSYISKEIETIDFDMQFISALYEQQLKNVINDIELALNNEYEKIKE